MTFQRIVFLLVVVSTMAAAQTALGQDGTPSAPTTKSAGAALNAAPALKKKGIGHMGCVYVIYSTIKEAIDICYPEQYSELQKHIIKWLPVMHDYWNANVYDEKQKLDNRWEMEWKKFGKFLNTKTCEQTKPLIDNLSKSVVGHTSEADRNIQDLLEQSDEPGRRYGCL